MVGSNSQWYGYVPGVLNVYIHEFRCGSTPLSNTPVSLVTVRVVSMFLQVTVVPTGTVIVVGMNAEPTISTFAAPAPIGVPDGVAAGVGVGVGAAHVSSHGLMHFWSSSHQV